MIYTEKQYEYLQQFEDALHHAEYENYFRIVNRNMLLELANIYKDVFKSDSKILNGCNKCILQDIKRLAKAYFNDKAEKSVKKAVEPEPVEQESQPEAKEQPKKTPKTTKTTKNKKK